jgi:hypothetical protein
MVMEDIYKMTPQTGSIVLYVCSALMALIGVHHYKIGRKGRALLNFFMAGLCIFFAYILNAGAAVVP